MIDSGIHEWIGSNLFEPLNKSGIIKVGLDDTPLLKPI
jgi:hypothetical protein